MNAALNSSNSPSINQTMDGMRVLFDKSPIPLIADESCVEEQDVEKCHGLISWRKYKTYKMQRAYTSTPHDRNRQETGNESHGRQHE